MYFSGHGSKLRNSASNSLLLFVGGLLVAACGIDQARVPKNSPSGEELFRGIVLASGPVAEWIPEIRDFRMARNFVSDPVRLANVEAVHDRLIEQIAARDRLFFKEFQHLIESGDEMQVQKAFVLGARALIDALISIDDTGVVREQIENPTALKSVLEANANQRGGKLDPELIARAKASLKSLVGKDQSSAQAQRGGITPATSVVFAVVAAVYVAVAVNVALAVNLAAAQAVVVAVSVAASQFVAITSAGSEATAGSASTAGSVSTSGSLTVAHPAPDDAHQLRAEMMIHSIAATFARSPTN